MTTNSILADFKTVYYSKNLETGLYLKNETEAVKTSVIRLPSELVFSQVRADQIKRNATVLIHSRIRAKNGSYLFMTGLQSVGVNNWFLGNDYEFNKAGKKVRSLILAYFFEDFNQLAVFYFNKFDKRTTKMRMSYARSVIPLLQKSINGQLNSGEALIDSLY